MGTTGGAIGSRDVQVHPPATGAFDILLTAAEQLVFASADRVTAIAAGVGPSLDAEWPTPSGGPDDRRAARGQ